MSRIVCQFSCGAASAVATKLALAQYGELTPAQIEWHVNWTGGSCVVVNSADEALAAIGATNG